MTSDPGMPRDPGMQAERTALAWQRTAVSALLLSLVLLAVAARHGAAALLVAALAAGVSGAVALVLVPRSVRGFDRRPTSPWCRLLAVGTATVALALGGIVAAVASAGALAAVASAGAHHLR